MSNETKCGNIKCRLIAPTTSTGCLSKYSAKECHLHTTTAENAELKADRELLDACVELMAVAIMRGEDDVPPPPDDPLLWGARYQDAWNDFRRILEEVRPGEVQKETHAMHEWQSGK